MNERDRELMSALMDGETSELELRRALRAVDEEPALARTWERWHIARGALQGRRGDFSGIDLRAAIARGIDAPAAPAVTLRPAWPAQLAGIAVAASVAFVAVFAWQSLQSTVDVPETLPLAQASPATPALPAATTASATTQTVAMAPLVMVRADGEELVVPDSAGTSPTAAQDRLNTYFARHAQAANAASAHGLAPYARVVSLEGERAP